MLAISKLFCFILLAPLKLPLLLLKKGEVEECCSKNRKEMNEGWFLHEGCNLPQDMSINGPHVPIVYV